MCACSGAPVPVRLFRFWGAALRLLVPDNLKSAVHKASFYDPEANRSYGAMASHYGLGILPARPRRLRDKAAVEAGVRFAPRSARSRCSTAASASQFMPAAMAARGDGRYARLLDRRGSATDF